MFVHVNRPGLDRPRSQSMAKVRRLLGWSLAFTLCLLGFTATAQAQAVQQAPAAPSAAASASGDAWLAPSAATVDAQGQGTVTTTTSTGQVTNTPPTAPAPAAQGSRTAPNADAEADADPEALTMFQDDLAPYGSWLDEPRYGRIWVPKRELVGSGFSPYVTAGHWALDGDDNWIWVSDYPFGDIVFHYGRWFYSAEYGWAWVPGRTYAPSWVVWRTPTSSSYAYVGWAPMPPRFGWFSTGVVWYSTMPPVSYVFCPSNYLFYPRVGVYIVHDPLLVGRLGMYTSFYYPPYGYYGWGYYGYGYGGMGYHHTHHYGPPVYRTGISQASIPRDRIAARPRVASPGATAGRISSSGRSAALPGVGSPRQTTSLGASGAVGSRRSTSSWTAPRTSPLARSSSPSAIGPRDRAAGFTPRSSGPTTTPRTSGSPRSSGMSGWSAPRSSGFSASPRASGFGSSPRSAPSFSASPRSSPSFSSGPRSSPSFSSGPSFRSSGSHGSPSFRSGGRHR